MNLKSCELTVYITIKTAMHYLVANCIITCVPHNTVLKFHCNKMIEAIHCSCNPKIKKYNHSDVVNIYGTMIAVEDVSISI